MTYLNHKHIIYDDLNIYVPLRYVNENLTKRFSDKTYEIQESIIKIKKMLLWIDKHVLLNIIMRNCKYDKIL